MVASPIGNLEDITMRALRVLEDADLIACEDTRRARKLCAHYEITTPLTSYHVHNEHRRTSHLLERVREGLKLALLTDAGTPAVSDPGFLMVRAALEQGIEPEIIPGPSALTFAITAAGLPVDRFAFLGFPPTKAGKRRTFVASFPTYDATVFVFEAPHRMDKLLREIRDVLGADTRMTVIREATKVYEERLRGTAGDLSEACEGRKWQGECVVAVNARENDLADKPED